MAEGVDLNCNAFLQPLLQGWRGRGDRVAKNTNRCAAVDFFEAFKDGAAKTLVTPMSAHIDYTQFVDGFNSIIAYPLRRREFREIKAHVERIFAIEIGQAVGGGLG